VSYSESYDRVVGTIREIGASMQGDPGLGPLVLAPIEILGIESLADGFATIRIRFKTLPLNQGRIANELRRRLLYALAGRGIKPFAGV
jgi:small conductance mechanosensitive channel